ncbi:GNAT family N-acetyltransferase [Paraburkholderia caribensis]|uniref:GCN5-related N-acetyltransferase n=3 Tax=Paraburkholderia TaxID=1822464 RepID=B2JXA4_PARP8|nr:GNAT family N-acetyltransferase [Paraburkholderia phymatum]ACC76262.1 GCN5-related N-acetyltransferase [Paraburkholderia phymatum STM815]PTB24295.1 N-acetyltransferase [Paraburkholderia caribensis]
MTFEWPSSLSRQDMTELVDLMNTVSTRETTLGFFEPITASTGLEMMESLDADLRARAVELLIARERPGGRIVGMLILARQALPARRHIVEMKRCVIEPGYRGRFVLNGWRLALERVKEMGCEMIVIDVRSDGKAEQLWRRLGFVEYGRLDDFARVNGRVITGYFLRAYVDDVIAYQQRTKTFWHRPDTPTLGESQFETTSVQRDDA